MSGDNRCCEPRHCSPVENFAGVLGAVAVLLLLLAAGAVL